MKELRSTDLLLTGIKRVHMIGIGGSGMCPLAEILHSKGYELSGSDNNEGDTLNRVRNLGIKVYMGHHAENIDGAELVVYSAAIAEDNPERVAAAEKGIPTMERSKLLGALTRHYDNVIGVCGTHGKTTTSSMITQILYLNKREPSAVIGGKLPVIGSNGICGSSDILVCESCEFVNTFLEMSPDISVLLNIDNDHLDYFKTMENLTASFAKFVSMSKLAFVNGDDKLSMNATDSLGVERITFGMGDNNDYVAKNVHPSKFGFAFDVSHNNDKIMEFELKVPGRHNVMNALAAISVCHYLEVDAAGIKSALEEFRGAGRRFEFYGEVNGFMLADDYAHHPTEIAATLSAAHDLSYNKVIAVFQPFTFSRTALLKDEFIEALSIADKVILTPIMGSREVNTYGISSEDIAKGLSDVVCVEDFDGAVNSILKIAQPGDIVITMGGGDIYKVAKMLVK
ncbi:MAG: UDP-N-acetylmuramate--L-alanine ligase [Acutalibacteraceae bacterium]|nr:UDP-N-acetylmuramate--L-alanine ligase [Acutalibacteraceae bacterium]